MGINRFSDSKNEGAIDTNILIGLFEQKLGASQSLKETLLNPTQTHFLHKSKGYLEQRQEEEVGCKSEILEFKLKQSEELREELE